MTLIAARARISNPFERLSEIAFGLFMAISITGALGIAARRSGTGQSHGQKRRERSLPSAVSRFPRRWCRSIRDTTQRCLQKS
jgi:hypothetical protein